MATQPTYKLFLVAFGAQNSSDNLNPSVAGGSWVEVGTFAKDDLDTVVASIASHEIGSLAGVNGGMLIRAVSVQISGFPG